MSPLASGPQIILRDYQQQAMDAIEDARKRRVRSGLIVVPTGGGKTTIFGEVVNERSDDPGFAALVIAHREELLTQAWRRIGEQNPHLIVSIEAGDKRAIEDSDVVVAGIQSICKANSTRLSWLRPSLVIYDEAHHACSDSSMAAFRRFGCFDQARDVFHLGFTATPFRLDNKPLHGHEKAIYEEVIFSYTLKQAIRDGYLVDLRGYRVSTAADLSKVKTERGDFAQGQLAAVMNTDPQNEHAFKSWAEVAKDRKTIVFCVTVEHSKDMAEVFRAHGIRAEHIDGSARPEHRDAVMRRFRDGQTQVLTNVEIATEGFDVPDIGCVVMVRPTQSWGLYAQMIGRGLRVLPGVIDGITDRMARKAAIERSGKRDAIVVDVVGNTADLNLATIPGLVGLPPKMDMQGHSVSEAIDLWEEMTDDKRGALFQRPTNFAGLTAKLQEVDLLAELSTPQEIANVARMAWICVGDGLYRIDCGSTSNEKRRTATMSVDPLGFWSLDLKSTERHANVELRTDDLGMAFRQAEARIRGEFEGAGAIATANSAWRSKKPTENQVNLLRRRGVAQSDIDRMTAGDASAMISKLMVGSKR